MAAHGSGPMAMGSTCLAVLGTGSLRIDHGREQKSFAVSGGFLQVVDDTVTVLSESAAAA
jgi:F-type H+-transporting ATPase subunit epsilon